MHHRNPYELDIDTQLQLLIEFAALKVFSQIRFSVEVLAVFNA